jgi:hypothetical protein
LPGQRQVSPPVWPGFRSLDTGHDRQFDRAEVICKARPDSGRRTVVKLGLTPQKPLDRAYQRSPESIEKWKREIFPSIDSAAKAVGGEVYFWDESGFLRMIAEYFLFAHM